MKFNKNQNNYTPPSEKDGKQFLRIKKNFRRWTTENLKKLSDKEFEEWRIVNRIGPWPDRYNKIVPWFNPTAVDFLEEWLPKNKGLKVLEFGCGGTTMYTSDFTDNMISIDHHTHQSIDNTEYNGKCHCEHYCELEQVRCGKARIKKIKLYMSVVKPDNKLDIRLKSGKDYYETPNEFPDNHFDLIYIDGEYRKECFINSLPKLKQGGYIFLDNVRDLVLNNELVAEDIHNKLLAKNINLDDESKWEMTHGVDGKNPETWWWKKL